ncbi:MAG: hypothetical protein LC776_10405 [Acidobacteria bacterium]|nr:hypothetical protein [Acidobacteriota bacterium]
MSLLSLHGDLMHSHNPSVDHVTPTAPQDPRPPGSPTPTPGRAVGPTGGQETAADAGGQRAIMQRDNEISRVFVDGRRVEDGDRCTFLAIQERTGHWAIYPHGAGKLGVRLPPAEAVKVAHAILAATG